MTNDFLKISALDPQDLEISIEQNAPQLQHSWRQEQSVSKLDALAQPFGFIAEVVDRFDGEQDGGRGAYRGALLALTAIVEVLHKVKDEDDDGSDITVEAAAVHLAGLDPGKLVANYEMATAAERALAKEQGLNVNDHIEARLRVQFPAFAAVIEKIVDNKSGHDNPHDRMIRYGAYQMLLALDASVDSPMPSDEEDLSDTWSASTVPGSND